MSSLQLLRCIPLASCVRAGGGATAIGCVSPSSGAAFEYTTSVRVSPNEVVISHSVWLSVCVLCLWLSAGLVEMRGFEPRASCVQSRRSPK